MYIGYCRILSWARVAAQHFSLIGGDWRGRKQPRAALLVGPFDVLLAEPEPDVELAFDAGDGGQVEPGVAVEQVVDGCFGDARFFGGSVDGEVAGLKGVAERLWRCVGRARLRAGRP